MTKINQVTHNNYQVSPRKVFNRAGVGLYVGPQSELNMSSNINTDSVTRRRAPLTMLEDSKEK